MKPADELLVKDLFDIDVAYLVDRKDVRHEKIPGAALQPLATPAPQEFKMNPGEVALIKFNFHAGQRTYSLVYEVPAKPEGGVVVYTIGEANGYFRLYDEDGVEVTLAYREYCQRKRSGG